MSSLLEFIPAPPPHPPHDPSPLAYPLRHHPTKSVQKPDSGRRCAGQPSSDRVGGCACVCVNDMWKGGWELSELGGVACHPPNKQRDHRSHLHPTPPAPPAEMIALVNEWHINYRRSHYVGSDMNSKDNQSMARW
jgi:hypothetical protein